MNCTRVWSSFSLELSLLLWWLVCYGAIVLGLASALMMIVHLSFVLLLVYFSLSLLTLGFCLALGAFGCLAHTLTLLSCMALLTSAKYFLLG